MPTKIQRKFADHAPWGFGGAWASGFVPKEQRKADRVFGAHTYHPVEGKYNFIRGVAGRVNPRVGGGEGYYHVTDNANKNTMNVYNPRKGRHGVGWTISPNLQHNINRDEEKGRFAYEKKMRRLDRQRHERKKSKAAIPTYRIGSAYADSSLQFQDPVSLSSVPRNKAYYIQQNTVKTPRGPRATAVYHIDTIKRLLASRQRLSPLSRRPFESGDVFKLMSSHRIRHA